jgi:hypothetical protein
MSENDMSVLSKQGLLDGSKIRKLDFCELLASKVGSSSTCANTKIYED